MSRQIDFISLFDRHAVERPDDLAVVAGPETLSYGMLGLRSDQLRDELMDAGLRPGAIAGVCLERSLLLPIALLGVLKAGAAYVAIDPASRPQRLEFLLDDADPALIVTQECFAPLFGKRVPPLCLDRDWHRIAARAAKRVRPKIAGRSLAYLVYTSGSTGTPKSVAIEHSGIAPLFEWARRALGPALARVLASSPLSFDMSVFELFAPLCAGGTVVLADTVLALPDLPGAERLTLVSTVPSAIEELALAGALPDSLPCVLVAGEALSERVVRRVFGASRVERIWNLYGVSEDTIYSTCAPLCRARPAPVTIGSPLPGREMLVLDSMLEPVAPGETGELYVGGLGLGRGYHRRPGLTAERFLPHPASAIPGLRIYRTGDVGRQRPDGTFECFGRIDRQFKIGGHRIEPAEIEAAIDEYTGSCSIVVAQRDAEGRAHLVAHVVSVEGTLDVHGLRRHLKGRMPTWMVPAVIRNVRELPRTPHGKLDRNALALCAGNEPAVQPDRLFRIVINAEMRHSIWPAERALPSGWHAVGRPRPKADCLAQIERRWTDMRPGRRQAGAGR